MKEDFFENVDISCETCIVQAMEELLLMQKYEKEGNIILLVKHFQRMEEYNAMLTKLLIAEAAKRYNNLG